MPKTYNKNSKVTFGEAHKNEAAWMNIRSRGKVGFTAVFSHITKRAFLKDVFMQKVEVTAIEITPIETIIKRIKKYLIPWVLCNLLNLTDKTRYFDYLAISKPKRSMSHCVMPSPIWDLRVMRLQIKLQNVDYKLSQPD